VVIYDSNLDGAAGESRKPQPTRRARFRICGFTNVTDALMIVEWYTRDSTTARSISSETIDCSTGVFERDVLMVPGRVVVKITTITAPSTWEWEADVVDNQALAQ